MNLALISGVAGILGLILQITDTFPAHRHARQAIVLLILGFFGGTVVAALMGATIKIEGQITPSYLLIAGLLAISAALLLATIFTNDENRRAELYTASGVSGGVMCAVFFLVAAAWAFGGQRQDILTLDEYLALSAASEAHGDFERAIDLTDRAGMYLPAEDPRKVRLEQRIERLKAEQVKTSSKAIPAS